MAGDWIKFEHITLDKPEVYQLASLLQIHPDEVLGKLMRVWVWADQQSRDGHVVGVTKMLIDHLTGKPGFGDALETVKWVHDGAGTLTFVNFELHNGQTAKTRAQNLKRKQAQRSRVALESPEGHAGNVTDQGQTRDQSIESRERVLPPPSNQISLDWQPSEKTYDGLLSIHGLPIEFIEEQILEFRTYWHERGGDKDSWDAAFITSTTVQWSKLKNTWVASNPIARKGGANGSKQENA
ncbi:MAG: DnaT-like ssDNA-binding domain-containing protein [Pseudomonadota bacterium]